MNLRLAGLLLAGVCGSACLQEDPSILGYGILAGRQAFSGRQIERPTFKIVDGRPHLWLEERTALPSVGLRGTSNVWLVDWETAEKRQLLANKSDRWPLSIDKNNIHFAVRDERTLRGMPVGTLTRFSVHGEILESIPDVSDYSVFGARFFWKRPAATGGYPELHLRGSDGAERVIEGISGLTQFTGAEGLFFVTGDDRTLSRVDSATGPMETLRARVTRMFIGPSGQLAILKVSDVNLQQQIVFRHIVFRFDDHSERLLPGANICCERGFNAAGEFVYVEAAAGDVPARLHYFNVQTNNDRVLVLPTGLHDITGIMPRPQSAQALFIDSGNRLALFNPAADPPVRALGLRAYNPTFTGDGKFLLYIAPDPDSDAIEREGPLLVQDAAFVDPPRVISPLGFNVSAGGQGGYFFISGSEPLVFWARYGRDRPDLFFANPESGSARRVAQSIRDVTVTPKRVVGIVRVSQQDLVGDLVQRDVEKNEQILIGRSVSNVTIFGGRIAFVVRERQPSARDGLWLSSLK